VSHKNRKPGKHLHGASIAGGSGVRAHSVAAGVRLGAQSPQCGLLGVREPETPKTKSSIRLWKGPSQPGGAVIWGARWSCTVPPRPSPRRRATRTLAEFRGSHCQARACQGGPGSDWPRLQSGPAAPGAPLFRSGRRGIWLCEGLGRQEGRASNIPKTVTRPPAPSRRTPRPPTEDTLLKKAFQKDSGSRLLMPADSDLPVARPGVVRALVSLSDASRPGLKKRN
jgi:hypothetical protein